MAQPNPHANPSAVARPAIQFQKGFIPGMEIKHCTGGTYDYKPHVHNELSIGCILRGSTELTLNKHTLRYSAGDGVLIPPMTTHRCAPHDINQWEYVMLFVPLAYYADAVTFRRPGKRTGADAGRLLCFLQRLYAQPDADTAETALLELLLAFGEPSAAALAEPGIETIRQIHAYIAAHVYEPITLDSLQQLSGLNKFTLIRQFKQRYATTPAAFHLQCRVAEAKRLLGMNRNVFAVCEALHFYDQAHLIREMRKMYGVTPAAYAAQLNR